MKTIEIKNRWNNTVLFTVEVEDDANLRGADLRDANLSGANLRGADLRDANLSGANLRGADLSGANLSGANLSDANLRDANLRGADLRGADLSDANLRDANLRGADLRGADLSDANLSDANLRDANLRDANLSGANLRGADLSDAKNIETAYIPIYCKWSHCIHGNNIRIGCKEKTIEEWDVFFASEDEYSTRRGTEEFKQIQAVYESLKSYVLFLKK